MDWRYRARAGITTMLQARDRDFVKHVLNAGLAWDTQRRAQPRWFPREYPASEQSEVDLGATTWRESNLDPTEQYIVASLAAMRRAEVICEIGTYDGASTLLLARNAPRASVYTLDLPVGLGDIEKENELVVSGLVGSRFRGEPEAERITQMFGDSRTYDFSSLYGRCDLVLVDAGHGYEHAAADTASALRLVHGGGVIIWDDYQPEWPGVVKAVDEIIAQGHEVVRFDNLAVLDFSLQPRRRGL